MDADLDGPISGVILELCTDNINDSIKAQKSGVHQIELCSRLDLDGLTPKKSTVQSLLNQLTIPVKVMIRPASGDFYYTKAVFDKMKAQISSSKELGVEHVVFGILTRDNQLDLDHLKELRDLAYPMNVTIHKAIDHCHDIVSECASLISAGGFGSILSSGGKMTAWEGKTTLRQMQDQYGGEIQIIAAGSITHHNLHDHILELGCTAYHGRRIINLD